MSSGIYQNWSSKTTSKIPDWETPNSRAISRSFFAALVSLLQLWHLHWRSSVLSVADLDYCEDTLHVSRKCRCTIIQHNFPFTSTSFKLQAARVKSMSRDLSCVCTCSSRLIAQNWALLYNICWVHQITCFMLVSNNTAGKCAYPADGEVHLENWTIQDIISKTFFTYFSTHGSHYTKLARELF